MKFPGNILDGISRLFEGDSDEILVFILVFLFIFLSNRLEEGREDEARWFDSGIPIILIAIFLIFFLNNGFERELTA
jgi:hypothetical protein